MILAQLTPDAVQLAAWLGSAAFVLMLTRQAMGLHRDLRGSPANETLGSAAIALKERMENVEKRLTTGDDYAKQRRNAIYEELRKSAASAAGLVNELRKETTVMVGDMHEKINVVSQQVAGLQTGTKMQDQHLANIERKLDGLIARI